MFKIDGFFTSGWTFDESEHYLKNRYQMVNIGILLSASGLVYGIVGNYIRDVPGFIPIEIALLCMNFIMFFALRAYRHFFEFFAITMTLQYTFLFLYLIYVGEPSDLKHLWIFTYPIILLYFQKTVSALYWLCFILIMLLMAPMQNFVEIHYSMYQVTYISFVLIIISIIIYFYQKKIDEARTIILEKQNMLHDFNSELEKQVKDKTLELMKLNENSFIYQSISKKQIIFKMDGITLTRAIRDIEKNKSMKYRPRNTVYTNLRFTPAQFEFGVDFRYWSRVEEIDFALTEPPLALVVDGEQRVPAYITDLMAGCNFFIMNIPAKVYINAKNIFNYNYVEFIGNLAPIRNYSLSFELFF